MPDNYEYLSVSEWFVEVFHARGNITKFEIQNPADNSWQELDVWQLRRHGMEWWFMAQVLAHTIETSEPFRMLRVLRNKELEKDILDTTYHPSVESWKIDLNRVKEIFDGIE